MNKLKEIKEQDASFITMLAVAVCFIGGAVAKEYIFIVCGFGIIITCYLRLIFNVLVLSMEYFIKECDKNVR